MPELRSEFFAMSCVFFFDVMQGPLIRSGDRELEACVTPVRAWSCLLVGKLYTCADGAKQGGLPVCTEAKAPAAEIIDLPAPEVGVGRNARTYKKFHKIRCIGEIISQTKNICFGETGIGWGDIGLGIYPIRLPIFTK